MNAVEKRSLSIEAEMQINALKKISIWRTIAVVFFTIGVAVTYAGMAVGDRPMILGILGIILIIVSAGCAILLNLGLRNGRKNVEKILNILDKKTYEV